jgi:phosphatidylserine decarboxylase
MYYFLLRWFPKTALTRFAGWLADVRWPKPILRSFVFLYVRAFKIDLSQFESPTEGWATFNVFFTRSVKPESRPLSTEPNALLCPVDGKVIEAGRIQAGQLLQAKGITYSLAELLDSDPGWSAYEGGAFATIYLHPRDYHRIHSPCAGDVVRYRYVPGELWSVSPPAVRSVPGLFSRNERWISFLRTAFGEVAVVKVGATIVGRIGVVYPPGGSRAYSGTPQAETLRPPHTLAAGAELGRFELGSTVILLIRPGEAELDTLRSGQVVRMGAKIGSVGPGIR